MIRKHSPPHSVQEMKFFITTVRIIKTPHNVTANKKEDRHEERKQDPMNRQTQYILLRSRPCSRSL